MANDDELLEAYVCAGDEGAFRDIMLRYQGLVAGVARTLVRRHEVDDVVQETFLALSTKAREIRTTLAGWLYSTARNHAMLMLRRRRQLVDDGSGSRAEPAVPESDDPERELLQDLDQAMAKLPEEDRVLLLQRFGSGVTLIELAQARGIGISALHARVEKALAKLRQHLRTQDASSAVVALAALAEFQPSAKALEHVMAVVLARARGCPDLALSTTSVGTWLGAILLAAGLCGAGWLVLNRSSPPPQPIPPAEPIPPPEPMPALAPVGSSAGGSASAADVQWTAEALTAYHAGKLVDLPSEPLPDWLESDLIQVRILSGVVTKTRDPFWHRPEGSRLEQTPEGLLLSQPAGSKQGVFYIDRAWTGNFRFECEIHARSGATIGHGIYAPQAEPLVLPRPVGRMRIDQSLGDKNMPPGALRFLRIEGVVVGHRGQVPVHQIRSSIQGATGIQFWLTGPIQGIDLEAFGEEIRITRARLFRHRPVPPHISPANPAPDSTHK